MGCIPGDLVLVAETYKEDIDVLDSVGLAEAGLKDEACLAIAGRLGELVSCHLVSEGLCVNPVLGFDFLTNDLSDESRTVRVGSVPQFNDVKEFEAADVSADRGMKTQEGQVHAHCDSCFEDFHDVALDLDWGWHCGRIPAAVDAPTDELFDSGWGRVVQGWEVAELIGSRKTTS